MKRIEASQGECIVGGIKSRRKSEVRKWFHGASEVGRVTNSVVQLGGESAHTNPYQHSCTPLLERVIARFTIWFNLGGVSLLGAFYGTGKNAKLPPVSHMVLRRPLHPPRMGELFDLPLASSSHMPLMKLPSCGRY